MTLGAIALLLFLILAVRLHAFLALLISSMALGLGVGMEPVKVIKSIQAGFGDALGFIAVVVALGAMIGRFLEHSGGGRVLADWLLQKFGKENAVWAVLVAAFMVGLPIFFEVGFIILVPLAWSLAKESKKSLLYYGLPMTAALTVTHAMVPPHPAPSAAASLLGADLGRTILYGAMLSIPMAISGGILYGRWIANRLFIPVPEMATRVKEEKSPYPDPSVGLVILVLVLPVLFIFASSVADIAKFQSGGVLGFLGHPFTALLITALVAMYAFGVRRGLNRDALGKMATDSLAPIGTLLAIMGGGGAFKQIIVGDFAVGGCLFSGGGDADGAGFGDCGDHHGGRHCGAAGEGYSGVPAGDDCAGVERGRDDSFARERRRVLDCERVLRHDGAADVAELDDDEGDYVVGRHCLYFDGAGAVLLGRSGLSAPLNWVKWRGCGRLRPSK